MVIMMGIIVTATATAGVVLQKVAGEVSVRQGVAEEWMPAKAGMQLGPETTIRTGEKSTAQLSASGKVIRLPGAVIVDISDIRDLSQEELLLKLTMQKVREAPYHRKGDRQEIPNATVVHGRDATGGPGLPENNGVTGERLLRGTQVLYDNGFFSTCALKTMEVVQQYPSLKTFATGWLVAESLERAGLRGEALSAFVDLGTSAQGKEQQDRLQAKITGLKAPR